MAPPKNMAHCRCIVILCLFTLAAAQTCNFPGEYLGEWFSMEDGRSITTLVNNNRWGNMECRQRYDHPRVVDSLGGNTTFLLANVTSATDNRCFFCVDVLYRTPNILQYRLGECLRNNSGVSISLDYSCPGKFGLPSVDEVVTLFRIAPLTINCISTFEGVYQFTYEVDQGGGGICDNPNSVIEACQDPGSAYVDNQVFMMKYAACRDVSTSANRQVRYQCMGTWFAVRNGVGYTYAAIADTVQKDNRERFKCLLTLKNQKDAQNKIRWVMSRFADCVSLNSIYNGPLRLVLTRIPPATPFLTPQCSLPRNITGTWFTQGIQYKSKITINETHIYKYTVINEFEYQETYFSCQQSQGSRYLLTKVVVGRCEKDFECWDIVPRHHSIVRYRIGKPFQDQSPLQTTDPKAFLMRTFREACSWTAFTFNRDDYDWKYEVMIMDPPSPVPCPVAGRYYFTQNAASQIEKYQTRIRGVTEKPRVQVDCRSWVPEFKSCSNAMSRIEVDAEYCETVDYRGRPIGEYDEPDNFLQCVGFWMEDMRSYLITYDEEDAISSFRCWVYERLSWTNIMMSRAQNARCVRNQYAETYTLPGTGLSLELQESERLFDDCPQRFDPGSNPYSKPITLYVLSGVSHVTASGFAVLPVLLLSLLLIVH
ncbi:hypothetical protein ACJMK2_042165 [Sinanodonta woodiana]|uniref:Uncharacterized protein n=1 Tax=Sinanodonta woodiana TaxID=1069815 RepID=A0ABD3W772_SINWO